MLNSQHTAHDEEAAADFEIPGVDKRELARWIMSNLRGGSGHIRIL